MLPAVNRPGEESVVFYGILAITSAGTPVTAARPPSPRRAAGGDADDREVF